MNKITKLLHIGIMSATLMISSPSLAKTYWVCAAVVPISKNIGVKLGLLGPGARWKITYNGYFASFDTEDDFSGAKLLSDKYESEYLEFLTKSGYNLTSLISDGATTSVCVPKATQTEINNVVAKLNADTSSNNVVDQIVLPTYIKWKPQTVANNSLTTAPDTLKTALSIPQIGIKINNLTEQGAAMAGLDDTKGALVMDVVKDSRAEKIGIKKFDIITEISGQRIENAKDINDIISKLRIGYKAPFRIWRNKTFIEIPIEITIDLLPPTEAQKAETAKTEASQEVAKQLKEAVRLALEAEKKARAKAEEAKTASAKAFEIAKLADEAAKKAKDGIKGFETSKYQLKLNSYKDTVTYYGENLPQDNSSSAIGLTTYKSSKYGKYSGQMNMFTNESGTTPKLNGYGVSFVPEYTMSGKWIMTDESALLVASFKNDTQYGEFKDGLLDGLALVEFNSDIKGQFLAGEFKNNTLNGYGVAILKNGRKYVGKFTNNAKDGPGVEYSPEGNILRQGIWQNNELVTPLQ